MHFTSLSPIACVFSIIMFVVKMVCKGQDLRQQLMAPGYLKSSDRPVCGVNLDSLAS